MAYPLHNLPVRSTYSDLSNKESVLLSNKNKPAKTGLFLLEIQTGQFRYKKE